MRGTERDGTDPAAALRSGLPAPRSPRLTRRCRGGGQSGQSKANRLQRWRDAGSAGSRRPRYPGWVPRSTRPAQTKVTIRANPADGQGCSSGAGLGKFEAPSGAANLLPRALNRSPTAIHSFRCLCALGRMSASSAPDDARLHDRRQSGGGGQGALNCRSRVQPQGWSEP
jgi:hypothetical protein